MTWQDVTHCWCCRGCVHLKDATCLRGKGDRCNGMCADRTLPQVSVLMSLTVEERARCLQFARHPVARFPLLTSNEMRRLLWYQEYFGEREHAAPTRPLLCLSAEDYQSIQHFMDRDIA